MSTCTNCDREIPDESEFCPYCGKTVEKKNICSKCGKVVEGEFTFCPYCGSSLLIHADSTSTMQEDVSVLKEESASKHAKDTEKSRRKKSAENNNHNYKRTTIIISILLAISLVGNAVLGYYTYHYYDLTWYWYNENVKTEQHLNDANAQAQSYKNLFNQYSPAYNFYMDHACIVDDYSDYYHVYGCPKCDLSRFLIFNIENAKGQGYSPCPYCH